MKAHGAGGLVRAPDDPYITRPEQRWEMSRIKRPQTVACPNTRRPDYRGQVEVVHARLVLHAVPSW